MEDAVKKLSVNLRRLVKIQKLESGTNIKAQTIAMGIPYPTFYKYVRGKIVCPVTVLVRIADYYGVSLDELLGRKK